MSFSDHERSRDRGEPIVCYIFRFGSPEGAFFAYTDAVRKITLSGLDPDGPAEITFLPTAITHSAVSASGTLDRATIDVETPQVLGIADLFRLYPPSDVVTLTIWHGHANDESKDFLVEWAGRVVGFSIESDVAHYSCLPIASSLRRAGLRRNYQYGCPHALYGPQCKANKAAAGRTQIVLGVAGSVLTFDNGWNGPKPAEKYLGGLAEWLTPDGRIERRTIIDVEGTLVRLAGVASALDPGETVTLYFGCDHFYNALTKIGDCKDLHNNILNYGGQPWIPLKSPFGIKNIYY